MASFREMREMDDAKKKALVKKVGIIGISAIVLLFLILILNPLVIINAGQRGVVLNFGAVQNYVLGEGLHFRVPIYQKIIKMDVQIHKAETEAASASKDIQEAHATIAVNYHVLPDKTWWVWQNIGESYKERVVDPMVQEVFKAVTARFTAVELITQREKVRLETKEMLTHRLLEYGLGVDDLSIVNFAFGKNFTAAVEAKQTAEQLALKATNDLRRIEIEAKQIVAKAQAEAESLRLQKMNITPDLVQLRQIEAAKMAIEKWDGKLPSVTGGVVPFIDAKSYTNTK